MQNKLKLSDLKVKSFITNVDLTTETIHVRGGSKQSGFELFCELEPVDLNSLERIKCGGTLDCDGGSGGGSIVGGGNDPQTILYSAPCMC